MNIQRIRGLIDHLDSVRILVVGDFFLDQYLDIDRNLQEISIETGLQAHQVTQVRNSPGAAGNVAANLATLGVQTTALTVVGDDGNGYELIRELMRRGIDTESIVKSSTRVTPTYTKPLMHEPDGSIHELERLDIKNHSVTPSSVESSLVSRLEALVSTVDGIIIADQVEEENQGVITKDVRDTLIKLAEARPQTAFVADSRCRIGSYASISLKPNDREAAVAVGMMPGEIGDKASFHAGMQLYKQTKRPVYLTRGSRGIDVFDKERRHSVPAVQVDGEIDTVGAGDSTVAGLTSALCAGATPQEAALIGCLCSSVTVRCIGTTGTATRANLLEALDIWRAQQS